MTDKIIIFDTTLRDGEQAAGVALNGDDKMQIAKQLERLGVDVIEAGFAASSPGDFDAVAAIAREVKGATIASLAAPCPATSTPPGRRCATPRRSRASTSFCLRRTSTSCTSFRRTTSRC